MRILVIIPARSGSKGVPNKNVIDLGGKPLIAHSIEPAVFAQKSGRVAKVVVSTDSEAYRKIAVSYGAEAPFLRPEHISGDKAKSIEFILHALSFYQENGETFDAVMLLQPTSPLRKIEDIYKATELFHSEPSAESLISVYQEDYVNERVMYQSGDDGFGLPLSPDHNSGSPRQEHGPVFVRNGSLYLTQVQFLLKAKKVISDRPILFVMPKWRSANLDCQEDLEILRRLL